MDGPYSTPSEDYEFEECYQCEGTGRCYNNADPTCGQWVPCELCKGTGVIAPEATPCE